MAFFAQKFVLQQSPSAERLKGREKFLHARARLNARVRVIKSFRLRRKSLQLVRSFELSESGSAVPCPSLPACPSPSRRSSGRRACKASPQSCQFPAFAPCSFALMQLACLRAGLRYVPTVAGNKKLFPAGPRFALLDKKAGVHFAMIPDRKSSIFFSLNKSYKILQNLTKHFFQKR